VSDKSPKDELPTIAQLVPIIREALRQTSGALSNEDMLTAVVRELNLSDAQLALVHDAKRGSRSEISYRMAWARTVLRAKGVMTRVARGRWILAGPNS
jgi:restriction system protein